MAGPAFEGISVGLSPALPEHIQLRFQVRRCVGPVTDTTLPIWWISTTNLSSLDNPISNIQPSGKGTLTLKDSALALFHVGATDPTNKAALDALCKQIAQDFLNWRCIEFDQVFSGILKIDPTGLTDLIEWSVDSSGDPQTRIFTSPWGTEAEEFQHNDPANANCTDANNNGTPVSQAPGILYYHPLAFCSGGNLNMIRYKAVLIDGRLFETYVSTDVIH